MSVGLALLLSIIAGLAYLSRRIGGDSQFERPIVLAPIIGLILGDVSTGIVIGGTLELIFIGAAAIGGAVPPNVVMATVLGTAFAIRNGEGVETALLVAVPTAVVAVSFELFAKGSCSFLVHRADRAAIEPDTRSILGVVWTGNAIHFFAYAVPAFLALYFGDTVVQSLTEALDGRANAALTTAAALLPAVGFGILLTVLYTRALVPLFIVGFAIAAYTDFTVIGIAIVAVALIVVLQGRARSDQLSPA
jgi:fructoselysine and glucoselysine-specific PTS system IIC component